MSTFILSIKSKEQKTFFYLRKKLNMTNKLVIKSKYACTNIFFKKNLYFYTKTSIFIQC
jgi:hypothetical protein